MRGVLIIFFVLVTIPLLARFSAGPWLYYRTLPGSYPTSGYERFEDGSLWFNRNANVTVVYFHGRGRSVEWDIWFLQRIKHNVLAIEYPDINKFKTVHEYILIEACIHRLRDHLNKIKSKRLLFYGSSFGNNVMLKTLEEFSPEHIGIVLENPLLSISKAGCLRVLGEYFCDNIGNPFKYIFEYNDWDVSEYLKKTRCPILHYQSVFDELVPVTMLRKLQPLYHNASIMYFPTNHGEIKNEDKVIQFLNYFIDKNKDSVSC